MENKKIYGFAIYGCGSISGVHAAAICEIEDARLVGAADLNPERAEKLAREYGARVFLNFEEILESNEVDVICICTPSGTHAELAIRALGAGKNVVVEKPMAINSADCERIIAACRESDKRLAVISQMREKPDIIRAKQIIESGRLGKIVLCNLQMKYYRSPEYYRGSWRGTLAMDGGGALMNQGIHGIDMIYYLLGRIKPETCRSTVRTMVHDIEVEDTAAAICELESGAICMIAATTSVYPGFSRVIEICGSRGTIVIKDGQIERLSFMDDQSDITYDVIEGEGKSNASAVPTEWHKRQIERFIRSLSGADEAGLCDEYQGKISVDLIELIYKNSN